MALQLSLPTLIKMYPYIIPQQPQDQSQIFNTEKLSSYPISTA